MAQFEVTLIALNIRKWDLESQRINLTTYIVLDKEEQSFQLDLSITQPPEMVEEFLGKVLVSGQNKLKNGGINPEEIHMSLANETFIRQKFFNYFKRIMMELNNPKRKKGQSKMIFTTHLDVYSENQDISFLPQIIQFYVILNWARKYYEKDEYQKAVEPLRKLVKVKSDFGLGYKWLARSLKKIRKYDDAMYFYEKYAEVDNSLDSRLNLAKSYRKGKIFDKSEKIYQEILDKDADIKEARIGLAQIKYARGESEYLDTLDALYKEDPNWVKKWLLGEFNFRIYTSPKTPLTPIQTAHYLGYDQVYELSQRAFRNEVPSHFNPSRARMSFYKEELDKWAYIINRFECKPETIRLYPEKVELDKVKPVEIDFNKEGESKESEIKEKIPAKKSSKVEDILKKIRESRASRNSVTGKAISKEYSLKNQEMMVAEDSSDKSPGKTRPSKGKK